MRSPGSALGFRGLGIEFRDLGFIRFRDVGFIGFRDLGFTGFRDVGFRDLGF